MPVPPLPHAVYSQHGAAAAAGAAPMGRDRLGPVQGGGRGSGIKPGALPPSPAPCPAPAPTMAATKVQAAAAAAALPAAREHALAVTRDYSSNPRLSE